MNRPEQHVDEKKLYQDISHIIEKTQQQVLHKVSQAGVMLYWYIGNRINTDILKCDRAVYGKELVSNLATQLQIKYGSGYGQSTLYRCVQFSKVFDDKKIVL